MTKPQINIQDSFLNQARRDRVAVTLHLADGSDLYGKITAFDNFTVVIVNEERDEQYLVYKHAIASIQPAENIRWNQQPQREGMRPPSPDMRRDRTS
ncbi:MAG: RNA-binding protein Hfq [bacterium]|nr:RNA-binding protein Hfq [bacterium]